MTPTQHRRHILTAPDLAALNAAVTAAAAKLDESELDRLTAYARTLLTGVREPIGKAALRWLHAATLGEWGYSHILNYAALQTFDHRGPHLITCNRYIMFAVAVPAHLAPGLYALDTVRGEAVRTDLDPAKYPDMNPVYRGRYDAPTELIRVTGTSTQGATPVYHMSNGQLIARKHLDTALRLRGHGPIQPIAIAGHTTRPIYLDAAAGAATAMLMPIHPDRT